MVMVVHWDAAKPFLPEVARMPWTGVDLFFVISGFVVTLSLVRLLPPLEGASSFVAALSEAAPALRTFYARRFFRILPAALAAAILYRELNVVFPEYGALDEWTHEVIAFFGGVYNYGFAFHPANCKLGVYWSLSVEEHFYLILPVLFVLLRTTDRRLVGCAVVAGVSIACRLLPVPAGADLHNWEKFSSHLRFDSLMAGVALALLTSRNIGRPIVPRGWIRFLFVPGLLLLVMCLPQTAPDEVLNHVGLVAIWALAACLVSFAAKDRGYVLQFPVVGRVLEVLGARSYALYLLHMAALWIDRSLNTRWPRYAAWIAQDSPHAPWRQLVFLLGVALVLAEILHRVVERPCIALGRRRIDRARSQLALSGGPESGSGIGAT
jgi:peptidoglycan/LPS O-acetylase OafA/YrhL